MPTSQIHHVDVVAHTGAIGGCIVIAKDRKLATHAARHLADKGHQVIGYAKRVFANLTTGVGTHGVEIAQACHPPERVYSSQVRQYVLNHQLALAIRVGGAARGICGSPYTVADDENTSVLTLAACMACSRHNVPPTLLS